MIFISPFYPATQKPTPPRVLASGSVTAQVFNLTFDPEYPFNEAFGAEALRTGIGKRDTQFKAEGDELVIVT